MTEAFATRVRDRAEAYALMRRYLEDLDDAVIAPVVRGMSDDDDEAVMAVMTGSGNEMSLFNKALYLMRAHGVLTKGEVDAFLDRRHAVAAARVGR